MKEIKHKLSWIAHTTLNDLLSEELFYEADTALCSQFIDELQWSLRIELNSILHADERNRN
jgi:hypothetical protein